MVEFGKTQEDPAGGYEKYLLEKDTTDWNRIEYISHRNQQVHKNNRKPWLASELSLNF